MVMVQVFSASEMLHSLDTLYYHFSARLVYPPLPKETWEVLA